MNNKGFSLVEFLIVLSIIAILAAFFVFNYNLLRHRNSLDVAAEEMAKALRLAQSRTLASESASSYGVYFESDKYVIFKGAAYDPAATADNESHQLANDVLISQVTLGTASATVFARLTGQALNSGSIRIEQKDDPAKFKIITVDASGIISFSNLSIDESTRLADSRHVHVFYNQNVKSAVTLSLFFPNDSFTSNLNFQGGLNAAQTEFFWEGAINVSGSEQKLKIHTHTLDDGSAVFCVHRDRRFNSKSLGISLDGQNIINYTATGTTTQGTSIWAGLPLIQ